MKTPALVLLLLSALFLSACENFEPLLAPDVEENDAVRLMSDLNEHLDEAGAPRCAMKNRDLETGYAATIPNQGAAVCRFPDGSPLFVLSVADGEKTHRRHIGRQFGPNRYSRGPTWIVIADITTPPEALTVIKNLAVGGRLVRTRRPLV
jgi:hypothetical protein